MKGRRPVCMPKKTWSKVEKEDLRKLNIMGDMTQDRQQWRRLISHLTPGVGTRGDKRLDDIIDDDDDIHHFCKNDKLNIKQ